TPGRSRNRCRPADRDRAARGSRAASRTGDSRACASRLRTGWRPGPRAAAAAGSRDGAALRTRCRVDLFSLHVAGLAGNAELVFGTVVIRLQTRVAQRPVGERGVFRNGGRAVTCDRVRARAEVILVQAP